MSYTLLSVIDGVSFEHSLADWGIEADSAVLVLNSFEADVFSFTVDTENALAAAPFFYGQTIYLKQDGVIRFIGKIRELPVYGSALAERQRFVAYNFWYELEAWTYQQHRRIINEDFSALGLVASSQVILGRNPATGTKITNNAEIYNLCAYAALSVTPAFTGLTPPFEQATDIPVATALRRMVAWQPNLLGRAHYAAGVPQLIITDPGTTGTVSLDATSTGKVISLEGKVRHDLKPDGVWIIYLTTVVDPATGIRYLKPVQDLGGAPTTGPFTMVSTLNVGDGENAPLGLAAAYYAALSTKFVEGSLVVQSAEADLGLVPGNMLSLANAPATWAGANAPITSIVHDLGSGQSTLNFGPPQFLPFASFALLNARIKDSRDDPTEPIDGAGDGTDGTDGGNGGTHDTGRSGRSGGGGSPSSTGISHCVGGTQQTTRVLTA